MNDEKRTCPACRGMKVVEYEAPCPEWLWGQSDEIAKNVGGFSYPRATGPATHGNVVTWMDTCQLCDGEGMIEVLPIEMGDLPS